MEFNLGRLWLVLLLGSFSVLVTANDTVDVMIPQSVKASLQARVDKGLNVGFAVSVITSDQEERFTLGRQLACDPSPVTHDSIFEIGSVTKVFTALLISRLIQEGHFSWEDTVQPHIKSCSLDNSAISDVTFSQLVSHTSGLPRLYLPNFKPQNVYNPYQDYTEKKFCEALNKTTLGERNHQYSNIGYGLLGKVIEDTTDMTLEAAFKRYLFDPLKLNKTTFGVEYSENRTLGHIQNYPVEHWHFASMGATGWLKSNLVDMEQFMKMMMLPQNSELTEAIELSQQKRANIKDDEFYMAAGWHVIAPKGKVKILYHNGMTGGYASFVGINSTQNKAVVVLSNSATSVDDIGLHLLHDQIPLANVDDLMKSVNK